ncbi:Kazal-type serine protease inhibitor family protein [Patescibacteria group bacterium]|nr:Kazal-type serine protease inhibitor family protein [Patescibacteria group bacterium]
MSAENQEKFKEYIKGISGDKEKQLEILESIKTEVQEKPKLEEKLNEVREKILEKVENKLLLREVCPVIDKPLPDFCEKGRIVIEKDKNECISAFRCVMPTETEISSECEPICKGIGTKSEGWYNPCTSGLIKYANCGGENSDNPNPEICTTLWDPVCGEDNKTYSNKCSAKLAGVGIVYAGECKKAGCDNDSDCPQVKCGATNVVKCPGAIMKCINGTCTRISTPVKTAE